MKIIKRLVKIAVLSSLVSFSVANAGTQEALIDSGSTGGDGALEFYVSPPNASGHYRTMVYDHARQLTVYFDGNTGLTWEFDGVKWISKQTVDFPVSGNGLWYAGMAYDRVREKTVLFGGRDENDITYYGDTWEYDGVNWVKLTPVNSPSPRRDPGMVYDVARQEIVLVGGYDGSHIQDTWTWNGINWTEKAPVDGINENRFHKLAYDEKRSVVVYLNYYNVFEWDGTNWVNKGSLSGGLGWTDESMFYNPLLEQVVVMDDDDMRMWNGTSWTNIYFNKYNFYRDPVVFDVARGQVVGLDNGYTRIWDGANWIVPSFVGPVAYFDMNTKPSGVWNYTTIDVPVNIEVRFLNNDKNTPVVWLATDDVNINGILNLNGQDYNDNGRDPVAGNEPIPGPGGGRGGLGGRRFDISGSYVGFPGEGQGGGLPGTLVGQSGGIAGHAGRSTTTSGSRTSDMHGAIYGNRLIHPLEGGSGGGGSGANATSDGYNGGAGGGAILIASNTTIHVDGEISVEGGYSSPGGLGSGGSIRLVASRIEGTGTLDARDYGRIRTEAFYNDTFGFTHTTDGGSVNSSLEPTLGGEFNNYATQLITVISVDGVNVATPPQGNLNAVDVVFTGDTDTVIALAAPDIPVGTVINVRIISSSGIFEVDSTPTDVSGNATATTLIPSGLGKIQAFASFVPAVVVTP